MAHRFEGSKYDDKLSRDERKAAILAHLQTLIPAGSKVTLREARGRGTMNLTATISNVPFALVNAETLRFITANPTTALGNGQHRSTPEAEALVDLLESEAKEFGFDDSDVMTDYFNCAFYFNARINPDEVDAETQAIIHAASAKRRVLDEAMTKGVVVYTDKTLESGKQPTITYRRDGAVYAAGQLDKAMGTDFSGLVQKSLAAPEDWDHLAGVAAQAACVAAKAKPTKTVKVLAVKKLTEKQINKKIEAAYYRHCSGVVIPMLDIPKVFAAGRKAYDAGATTDDQLGKEISAFVQTIRVSEKEVATARPAEVSESSEAALASMIAEVKSKEEALVDQLVEVATKAMTGGGKLRRLVLKDDVDSPKKAPAPIEARVFTADELAHFKKIGLGPDGETPIVRQVQAVKIATGAPPDGKPMNAAQKAWATRRAMAAAKAVAG